MKQQEGFSLIEIVVVVAIAAALVLVVSNFGNNVSGLDTLVSGQLQVKSDVNSSLQLMTTAIQSAETSANGGYPIGAAATGSFSFYSDIKKTGSPEYVTYFYASSSIYQQIIAPSGTPATYPTSSAITTDLIDNVTVSTSTPLFVYYDSSYTGTQSPMIYPLTISNIRLVGIAFSVQLNQTSTQRSQIQYFYSLADIRNLDSN